MKIMVTGGNGYVGRVLVHQLVHSHQVIVVDHSDTVRIPSEDLHAVDLRNIDIRDERAVRDVMADTAPDVIVHLAAVHYIPDCQTHPVDAVATNVLGTMHLLDACPSAARFVLASSAAVYRASVEPLHEERSALGPNDIYGMTKLQTEQYLRYYAAWREFPAVAVRLFNVVGPGETNPHVLPEIVAQLKAGRRTLELGNITPRRDFIHVADAAAGFASVALTGCVANGETVTVNLGTGEAHSVQNLIDLLATTIDERIEVSVDPSRFRRADNLLLLADTNAIRQRFGWVPRRGMKEAIEDMWREPDLPQSLIDRYLR